MLCTFPVVFLPSRVLRYETVQVMCGMNKTISVALIGLGKIAHGYEDDPNVAKRMKYPTHWSVLKKHLEFKLVAAADPDKKARTAFAKKVTKYGSVKLYSTWQELFKNHKPDVLVIASPTPSHVSIARAAIKQGVKFILCEKPISYSLKEAEDLLKQASIKRVTLVVNYFRAFQPSYEQLIEKLKKGVLGKMQTFDAKYSRGIYNNGTHLLDLMVRLLGKVDFVQGFINSEARLEEVDPSLSAFLRFKKGTSGYLYGFPPPCYGIFEGNFFYEKGRVLITNDHVLVFKTAASPKAKGQKAIIKEVAAKKLSADSQEGMRPVYENVLNFIQGKEKLRATAEEALYVMKIAEKVVRSAESGKKIYV